MANINIPRKEFESDIGKLDEKMQTKIAMFGTTLESFDDEKIELEIFPNRPDLLSYQGFKRSFLSFLGKSKGIKKYKLEKEEKDHKVIVDSSVNKIRPFTACAIVKDLKLDDERIKEIIDLQEKLHSTMGRKRKKLAIGIYPLEKIKLPIYYKAIEPDKIQFVPLESEKLMSGLEILQKHPTGIEYAHLLAGKTHFPIFTDSNKEILSMPPIINSKNTGRITNQTKEVFVECSGFDIEILKKCLNIIVTSLADMGGKIYPMEIKYSKKIITPNLNYSKKKINLEHVQKILGVKLTEKNIKDLLEKMGYNYSNGEVEIPSYRVDILHEIDLIEDIAIAYGYDNFEPVIPKISTIGEENPKEIIKRKISEILIGLGFLEVSNYHLTNKTNQYEKMGVSEKTEKNFVSLIESKTEYNIMRTDIAHLLLKNFSENIDSAYPQKIFEIGKVFLDKNKIIEKDRLALAIAPGNFTETKQILDYLFRMMGLKIKIIEPKKSPNHFIEGRVASIIYEEKEIGFIGEIHPKILKNWKIKMPSSLFELTLTPIYEKLIQ